MSAPIQVLAIRKTAGASSLKAFVDLQIGGVTIKGAKIVQQDGQKAWVAMPSIKTDRAWQNVVELSKPLRERVTGEVLRCWETHQPPAQEVLPPARQAERGRATAEALDERGEAWSRGEPLRTTPIPPDGDEVPF